jgi:hypothetical protein
MTTSKKMEDYLKNNDGRQPKKMEDDLTRNKNRRRPIKVNMADEPISQNQPNLLVHHCKFT